MSMWEPFTSDARNAMVNAQEVAQRYGSTFIDHNHIFVALCSTQTILHVLEPFDFGNKDVEAAAERVFGPERSSGSCDLVFSPYGKRLIELAFENARHLDNPFIDAEHLMLGYLSLGDAQKVMVRELGLDEGRFRQQLIDSLEPKPKEAPLAAKQGTPSPIGFHQIYDRVSQFAQLHSGADLWTSLRFAAEQNDPAAVLIYTLSIASHEGSSADEVIRRVELRLQELSGD